jgi:hypothetical protein
MEKDAEFHNLRAVGAFLVSASLKNGKVEKIEIVSEAGSPLKIILPWKNSTITNRKGKMQLTSSEVDIVTVKGEKIIFEL